MADNNENKIQVPRFNIANGFITNSSRSRIMAKVNGTDTKSEKALRKALWSLGIRYRKNDPKLPGKPDIVIPRAKLAIFIDGEFWHGYNWHESINKIKSNRGYWIPKIERNMQRDRTNNAILCKSGWVVLRFWEKELKRDFDACLAKIFSYVE